MKLAVQRELRGSALMTTIFITGIIAAMAGLAFFVTSNNLRATRRNADRAAAASYADGVLENLFDQWREQMISVSDPADRRDGLTTSQLQSSLVAPSGSLPIPTGLQLASWSVTAADPLLNAMPNASDRPLKEAGTASRLRVRLNYLARATVRVSGAPLSNAVTLERAFVRGGRSLFDDFLFSTQRITEIHPGAPMYIDRCQINGDAYLAHDFLHLMGDFNYTGALSMNYRPNDPRYGTAPTIMSGGLGDNWSLSNPPRRGPEQKLLDTKAENLESVFLDDPIANDVSSDGNPNNDGYREIIEEAVAGKPDPLKLDSTAVSAGGVSERLAENADYRIYVDASNVITIYAGESTVKLATTDPAADTAIKAAITPNTALKDIREADNVRLLNLDVAKLKAAVAGGQVRDLIGGDGLLIYAADTSVGTAVATKVGSTVVTSNRQRGVRLINGASLPSLLTGGFTVASPNPIYVQGDYNTGTTGTKKPASNTATSYTPPNDAPSPTVPGYEKVPAAVIGDAVNILSNSWTDANSLLSKGSRPATSTTVNAAIIGGNVPTTSSSYSGGIENFVRFHETWSGDYFTIYGALALLYASKQARGNWSAADYDPPNRRWFYDTLFRDANPPGIKAARAYDRGSWTMK